MVLSPVSAFAAEVPENTGRTARTPDIFRDIFGGIDEVVPDEAAKKLPYQDGTVLSDVREPVYMSENGGKIYGEENSSDATLVWKNKTGKPTLPTGTVNISGKTFALSGEMKILAAYEGDFDNIGRKTELALLVAARKKDGAAS